MNIPPKYEDVVAQLQAERLRADVAVADCNDAERRESSIRETLEEVKNSTRGFLERESDLREELDRSRSRYDREVLGLNNEGDPIGGDPAGGYKNDNARLQQRLTVAEQLGGELEGMLRHFALCADVRSVGVAAMSFVAALKTAAEGEGS